MPAVRYRPRETRRRRRAQPHTHQRDPVSTAWQHVFDAGDAAGFHDAARAEAEPPLYDAVRTARVTSLRPANSSPAVIVNCETPPSSPSSGVVSVVPYAAVRTTR